MLQEYIGKVFAFSENASDNNVGSYYTCLAYLGQSNTCKIILPKVDKARTLLLLSRVVSLIFTYVNDPKSQSQMPLLQTQNTKSQAYK